MHNIEIAFIINSFNRVGLLKSALKALESWIPNSAFANQCAVVIFDAGSTDGTIEFINTISTPLRIDLVIPNKGEDTSFSAGLNKGCDYAMKNFDKLKYLVFYETDNQITSLDAFNFAILELAGNSELGACGYTVKRHNGSLAGSGMAFPRLINYLLGKKITHRLSLESPNYKWIAGVSGQQFSYLDVVFTSPLLVKVECWTLSKGLDAKVFPFSDCDIDWAVRVNQSGFKMGVIKSDDVFHDNLEEKSAWSANRAKQYHRGRLRYFKRYSPKSVYLIWPLPLMLRHIIELAFVKIFIKDKTRRIQLSKQFKSLLKSSINGYE